MEIASMRLSDTQRVELYQDGECTHVILSDEKVEEYVMSPATALALLKWLNSCKEELEHLVKSNR